MRYAIFDPTGNITALVEDEVDVGLQPSVAARIMGLHPEVEQVGFVRSVAQATDADAELRMAGGEFCGNATMSTASWHLLRGRGTPQASDTGEMLVRMRVSGAQRPVEVRLCRTGDASFAAAVRMPTPLAIEEVTLTFGRAAGTLPLVRMEGISHLVIGTASTFFDLLSDRAEAEKAVRAWCAELGADGLGLMFLKRTDDVLTMTPLVFVPGGDTVFWENSCASGSSAVAICKAWESGKVADLALREPGGTLRAKSDPATGETWLMGSVRLTGVYEL